MPLFILFAASGVTWLDVVDDPMFRSGLVLQAIAAFWSLRGLYGALRTRTPEELRLKRRFALVFLRWVSAMMRHLLASRSCSAATARWCWSRSTRARPS